MGIGNLQQAVTHWTVVENGFGGFTYGAPKLIKGKWEEKSVIFISTKGVEQVSRAVVYLNADVAEQDYIFLGNSSALDPTMEPGALQVQKFHKTPDLRFVNYERKAFL